MGTTHSYRVLVQGTFDGLSDEARARLLSEADAHGVLQAQFTEDGTLAYDRSLRAFTWRVLVASDAASDAEDGAEDGAELAALVGEERVTEAMAAAGLGHGALRAKATDMDTVKINR